MIEITYNEQPDNIANRAVAVASLISKEGERSNAKEDNMEELQIYWNRLPISEFLHLWEPTRYKRRHNWRIQDSVGARTSELI